MDRETISAIVNCFPSFHQQFVYYFLFYVSSKSSQLGATLVNLTIELGAKLFISDHLFVVLLL